MIPYILSIFLIIYLRSLLYNQKTNAGTFTFLLLIAAKKPTPRYVRLLLQAVS